MIYGIENISLIAPLSLIVSIILFFGVVFIGDLFQKIFINKINSYKFIGRLALFQPYSIPPSTL